MLPRIVLSIWLSLLTQTAAASPTWWTGEVWASQIQASNTATTGNLSVYGQRMGNPDSYVSADGCASPWRACGFNDLEYLAAVNGTGWSGLTEVAYVYGMSPHVLVGFYIGTNSGDKKTAVCASDGQYGNAWNSADSSDRAIVWRPWSQDAVTARAGAFIGTCDTSRKILCCR